MAKTKKRSKKTKLTKKLDKKLLRDAVAFLFFTLAFYSVMYIAIYSGGSRDCAVAQEIEAGCNTDTPFSMILLLPSMLLGGGLLAGLKHLSEIKHQIKKAQK